MTARGLSFQPRTQPRHRGPATPRTGPLVRTMARILAGSGCILLAASVVLVASTSQRHSTPASAAGSTAQEPLRVMIEGDSMTQGFSGDTTWRYWVAREFGRQGVRVDFVGPEAGSSQAPVSPFGGRYARAFDSDHTARVSSQLFGSMHLGSIRQRMAAHDPDLIMLLLGYNDLNRGGKSAAQVADGLRQFVARVHGASPDTRVVIGKVMRATYRNKKPRRMPNDALNKRIDQLAAKNPLVTVANTNTGWKPRVWTIDGIHPNPTGETVLAQKFATALRRAKVLREPADLVRELRWSPRLVSRVSAGKGNLTVAWPRQKLEWSITRFRVEYTKVGGPGPKRATTNQERLTVRRLAPGTYAVRTIPIRKWMAGVPTPRVRVTVR